MSFKSNVRFPGFFRPLGASGHRNLLDRRPDGPQCLHSWLNLLHRRILRSSSLSRWSIRGILLRLFVVTTKGNRLYATRQKERKNNKITETRRNTYDAMRSKNSTSSSRAGASSVAVLWAEVLKEANSSTRFLFLSIPVSSESAGGGDVVELVSSSDSSASSPP
jgi:hypothetical protein